MSFEQPPDWIFEDGVEQHEWTNDVAMVGQTGLDYMPAVMMHEFGHTARLGHSAGLEDVMIHASTKSGLSANDIRAMKEIYRSHVAH